jgi:HPt (histidine-containing phosphotransfer) domain-containing protein
VSGAPAGRGPNDAPPLEGINVTGSLARLGLDYATFQKMLVRFAGSQGAMLEAVRAAVASGDSSEVARSAHTIAGASGNLGAEALQAAAKALERAGREGSKSLLAHLAADVEAAAAVVSRSIESLRGAIAPVAAGPAPLSIPPGARAGLEKLQAALGDFDVSAAGSAMADLERIAMPGAAGDLSQLRSHVDSYEYEEARALATRLLGQIGNGVQ